MMNLSQRYQEMIKELEKNLESQKDIEYVKNSFSSLFLDFLNDVANSISKIEKRTTSVEEKMKKIEEDLYINDDYSFEIVCPYCNFTFEAELDDEKKEVKCPECHNVIALDWNEECSGDCSSGCAGCQGHHEEVQEEPNENEDDM